MKDSEERIILEAFLENTETHLAYLDENFNFVVVNSIYAKGSGHSTEELIGKNHFDLFPNEENKKIFERARATGMPVQYRDKPFVYADQPKRGVTYWDWTLTPIKDDNNRVRGLVLSCIDVSERVRTAEALRQSEERYKLAQCAANIGSWDWDIVTGELTWSETVERMFGFEKGKFNATYEAFLNSVHPDDKQSVLNSVNACIEKAKEYDIEHRIVWPDGSIRWVRETGNALRNSTGKAVRMLGVVHDITERKKQDERKNRELIMKTKIEELQNIVSLFDSVTNGIIFADGTGQIRYINRRAHLILKAAEGQSIKDLFRDDIISAPKLTNDIVYSKTAQCSLLITRKKYHGMFLFILESLQEEVDRSRKIQKELAPYTFNDIIGLDDLKKKAQAIASQDVSILILGESGTGKELLASAIHNASPRAGKPYVPINCGAIPESLFESELFGYKKGAFTDARADRKGRIEYASGGAVFFDEIGDLPIHIQSKLLRVIEDKMVLPLGENKPRHVDVRFIFATNRDLNEMIKKKTFREDLYYRISAPVLKIPPLRERKEDFRNLISNIVRKLETTYNRSYSGISGETMKKLLAYDYPGNVRELEGMLKNAFLTSPHNMIEIDDLKIKPLSKAYVDEKVKNYRAQLVYECYLLQNKDIKKTARMLSLSTRQVYRYIKQAQETR